MVIAAVYRMRILQREFDVLADRLGLETEDYVMALFTK